MPTEITINAIITTERKKVWEYYTNSSHITSWNFADPSWHCPAAKVDLVAGGKYFARMEAKDGSFGFDFEAIFDEVKDFQSLSYTMPDGRKVKVQFLDKSPNTEVIVVFDAESENPVEMQRDGWQSILNNFKHYVESN